ncbi:MAG: hypothetical protein KAU29_11175 [Gammaproteobacteria bacterium]|nr:hypothetical protein [Gammaproteobacteria bacterium]
MKNNNKKLIAFVMLFAAWGQSFAETRIGLGTGGTSAFYGFFGGVISVPVRLDSNILIEPYIGYTEQTENVNNDLPDYRVNENESYQVGVGFYKIKELENQFEVYYGADVATGKSKRTSESKYTSGTSSGSFQNSTETTEYMIKPTLGISYLVDKDLSFSVDAGILYRWGEEETKDVRTVTSPTPFIEVTEYTADIAQTYTFTRIIFRMMF